MIATSALSAALLFVGFGTGGQAQPAPAATGTPAPIDQVAIETRDLVTVTGRLVWATFAAAAAAVAVPFVIELAHGASERRRAGAAREQLLVFLRAYEVAAIRLVAAPGESIAPRADALLPLFGRALALDIAAVIPPAQRSDVYTSLALAQQMLAEAAVRQQALERENATLDAQSQTSNEILAASRDYSKRIRDMQRQLESVRDRRERERLDGALRQLVQEQTAHNASPKYVGAQAFVSGESARRIVAAAARKAIGDDATVAQGRLHAARAALGDTSRVGPVKAPAKEPVAAANPPPPAAASP